MSLRLSASAVALLVLATAAQAQTQATPPTGAPPTVSATSSKAMQRSSASVPRADRSFAQKAAQAGQAEIDQAQLAQQKSGRQDVKDFAQQMVQDHTKAADQLKSIASNKGLSLPSGESSADQTATTALQQLSGEDFDRHYIEDQRKAHREAVALFSQESKSGKDAELKSFASQTLPTLQHHLQMITSIPLTRQTSSAPR